MSKRWLIGAAAVVGVLIATSILVAVLRGQRDVANYPANTAEGTVQRYLQAVWAQNYQDAYVYLSDDLQKYCTYQNLRDSTTWTRDQDMRVSLVGAQPLSGKTNEGKIEVEVRVSQVQMGQPFTPSETSYTQRLTLAKNGDDASPVWRFAEPPWPMSYCPGWNDPNSPRKPVPAAPPPSA